LTNRLFSAALHTGKRVRNETALAASNVSTSSVAVELAASLLGELGGRHVVIIGAGETAELTAQALAARGVRTIFVANRHADRAVALAKRFGGSVVSLDHLPEQLAAADIVLASTSSPHPIVGLEALELVMAERESRPLLLIDIAVPRDIEPACAQLEGVTLRDIDDLQAVVARNLSSRAADIPRAEALIAEEIDRFAGWLGQLDVRPTIAALRIRGEQVVEGLLAENAGRWESVSSADLERVEALARAVAARLLHEPTLRLKALEQGRGHRTVELLRELFALDAGEVADPHHAAQDAEWQQGDNVRPLRADKRA
jgi:glutamyl-tRNA reductase